MAPVPMVMAVMMAMAVAALTAAMTAAVVAAAEAAVPAAAERAAKGGGQGRCFRLLGRLGQTSSFGMGGARFASAFRWPQMPLLDKRVVTLLRARLYS